MIDTGATRGVQPPTSSEPGGESGVEPPMIALPGFSAIVTEVTPKRDQFQCQSSRKPDATKFLDRDEGIVLGMDNQAGHLDPRDERACAAPRVIVIRVYEPVERGGVNVVEVV